MEKIKPSGSEQLKHRTRVPYEKLSGYLHETSRANSADLSAIFMLIKEVFDAYSSDITASDGVIIRKNRRTPIK